MKPFNAIMYSALVFISGQLMSAEVFKPFAERPMSDILLDGKSAFECYNGSTVFQYFKSTLELQTKKDSPDFAARQNIAIEVAKKLNEEPESFDLAIKIRYFLDYEGLFVPNGSLKVSVAKKYKKLIALHGIESRRILASYAAQRFRELLEQTISKTDRFSVKVVDRFYAIYNTYVEDRDLRNNVFTLIKEGNDK